MFEHQTMPCRYSRCCYGHYSRTVILLVVLLAAGNTQGQIVQFDIQPANSLLSSTTNITPTPQTVVVKPGALVPYEIGVLVQQDPTNPNLLGLANFNISIFTDLGIVQPPLTAFSLEIVNDFPGGLNPGLPSGGNILNISGQQLFNATTDTAPQPTSPLTLNEPGINLGLGIRQVLGTGQLQAPDSEGTFLVTITGTASVFSTESNPLAPNIVPATVSPGIGFTIQTSTAATPGTTTPQGTTPPPATTFPPSTQAPTLPAPVSLSSMCASGLTVSMALCLAGLCLLKVSRRANGSHD
ncbi:MAG: hypothetical protein FWC56_02550 [Phycisphaerae bacterium]|nr:hypothetical protein [Phycisphaerae bacterium]